MIGDNPAADIRGANAAAGAWRSVLVRTGGPTGRDSKRASFEGFPAATNFGIRKFGGLRERKSV